MNYCPNCGTALEGNPLFCPECGAYLLNAQEKTAVQGAAVSQEAYSQPAAQQQYQQPQPQQQQYYQPPVQQEQPQYYQPPTQQNQAYNTLPTQQPNIYQGYASAAPVETPDKTRVGLVIVSFMFPIVGLILFFTKRKKQPKAAKSYIISAAISMALYVISLIYSDDEAIDVSEFSNTGSIVCEADKIPTAFEIVSQI